MTDTTTHLEELIAAERKKANDRITKLRKQAEAEQRKVDARVVELFKAQKPELHARLEGEARAALDAEKAERSRKAKRAVSPTEPESDPEAAAPDEPGEEVMQPWNG